MSSEIDRAKLKITPFSEPLLLNDYPKPKCHGWLTDWLFRWLVNYRLFDRWLTYLLVSLKDRSSHLSTVVPESGYPCTALTHLHPSPQFKAYRVSILITCSTNSHAQRISSLPERRDEKRLNSQASKASVVPLRKAYLISPNNVFESASSQTLSPSFLHFSIPCNIFLRHIVRYRILLTLC